MELVTPGLGLVFWMTVAFGIVLLVLRKYAWRPILNTIQEREETISQSLRDAKRIQQEMQELDHQKKLKLQEARKEYQTVLAHAKSEGEEIIRAARIKAAEETKEMFYNARKNIEQEKLTAYNEIKSQVALLSIDIAEKVLEEKFADPEKYSTFINDMLDRVSSN